MHKTTKRQYLQNKTKNGNNFSLKRVPGVYIQQTNGIIALVAATAVFTRVLKKCASVKFFNIHAMYTFYFACVNLLNVECFPFYFPIHTVLYCYIRMKLCILRVRKVFFIINNRKQ